MYCLCDKYSYWILHFLSKSRQQQCAFPFIYSVSTLFNSVMRVQLKVLFGKNLPLSALHSDVIFKLWDCERKGRLKWTFTLYVLCIQRFHITTRREEDAFSWWRNKIKQSINSFCFRLKNHLLQIPIFHSPL